MFDYGLSLMCGTDIPMPEISVSIHQPHLYEIAYMGEREFFIAVQCLGIQKTMITQDKKLLSELSNFQVFMTVMQEKEAADKKEYVLQLLTILFPEYKILFTPNSIILTRGEHIITIDEHTFDILQRMIVLIFRLENTGEDIYNPANEYAQRIAQKLMRGRKIVAEQKAAQAGNKNGSSIAQYISILTVGLNSMSLKDCMDLTFYQLYDLMERYNLYVNWDLDLRSRLAGGKPDKPADNWMKNIHEN